VNAAGTDQADQVKRVIGLLRPCAQLQQDRPAEEVAGGDRLVDSRQILQDRLTGAKVEVTDLGVAHLTLGQADELLGRLQGAMRQRSRNSIQLGMWAWAMASTAGSWPMPKPSRTTKTIGRGRFEPAAPLTALGALMRARLGPARAFAVIAARATMPAISSGLERGAADQTAVDRMLGQELADVGTRHAAAIQNRHVLRQPAQPRSAARVERIASAMAAASALEAVGRCRWPTRAHRRSRSPRTSAPRRLCPPGLHAVEWPRPLRRGRPRARRAAHRRTGLDEGRRRGRGPAFLPISSSLSNHRGVARSGRGLPTWPTRPASTRRSRPCRRRPVRDGRSGADGDVLAGQPRSRTAARQM